LAEGRRDEAFESARQALKVDAQSPEAQMLMGAVQRRYTTPTKRKRRTQPSSK
jgi:hypothetical protein